MEAIGIDRSHVNTALDHSRHCATNGQRGRATNWLVLSLLLDQRKTLALLSRNGLIRASSYEYNAAVPRHLVQETLAHKTDLQLTGEARSFFEHHLELMTIAPSARSEFKKLLKTLREEPITLLRSCLVTLELLFIRDLFPQVGLSLPWYTEEQSKETLSEGFSLLWSHAQAHSRITETTATLWDTEGILKGRYYRFLTRAAALHKYAISEILIDAFGYSCKAHGNSTVAIHAPDAEMEKARVWGYICDRMRRLLLSQEADETGAVSLRQFGQKIHYLLSRAGMIHDVQQPMRRVRFEYPISQDVFGRLDDPGSYREELSEGIEMDYGLVTDDILDVTICDHLKLRDVRAVKRLAIVLSSCAATELIRWNRQPEVIVNSVVPIFHDSDSLDQVLGIVLQPESARAFRQMFSWPPADRKPEYLDVQYQPILKAGTEWHVPLSILGSSDLSRAALKLTGKRPGAGQSLLERRLVQAFEEAECCATSEIELRAGGKTHEIDVASLIDDMLLILECKDSLIPRSILEMRTSLDACKKASDQLDRIVATLTDETRIQRILSNMGADGSPVDHVITGIVSGNGIFSGMKFGRHLVVSPGHLLNFVHDGEIMISGHRIATRKPGRVNSRTIRTFFTGSYYRRAFAAMVPAIDEIELGGKRLQHHTYGLDAIELARRYGVALQPNELSSDGSSLDILSGRST